MKFKILVLISIGLLVFIITGYASAFQRINIHLDKDLTLDFRGSRIRVETWQGDYVKIDTTYLVKEAYKLDVKNNIITFDKNQHLQKYPDDMEGFIPNEVHFIIKIPRYTGVNIYAESANIKKNCHLKSIYTRYARVRDSSFSDGFKGEGEKIYIRDSYFRGQKELSYRHVNIDNYRKYKGIWNIFINILYN